MSFTLDDLVIDRIQMGVAEKTDGTLLYTLTQLSEATIETTAESKEAKSAEGSLIKKFYQGKTGTFTATNAMINLNVIGAASGTDKVIGSADAMIQMPKIVIVNKGTATVKLVDGVNESLLSGTIRVNALGNNGAMGKAYTLSTGAASETEYALSGTTLTLPTDDTADRFVIKFERKAANAVKITNASDKFPGTVKLTLKALAVDPCEPDTLRSCYIIIPSFQVSPELSITLSTEGTLDYSGDMQISYCSADKELYTIVMCGDDEE
jgi:hypothetical protein